MLNPDGMSCSFKGDDEYQVRIPDLVIIDRAGTLDGNMGTGYTWTLKGDGAMGRVKAARRLIFGFVAVAPLAGGLFYWQWKKKRDAALAYGVLRAPGGGVAQEGDVVQTGAVHQVRLVPVFNPASEGGKDDGAAGRRLAMKIACSRRPKACTGILFRFLFFSHLFL